MPMLQGELIIPQSTRVPQPTFSAAMVSYVDAHYDHKTSAVANVTDSKRLKS